MLSLNYGNRIQEIKNFFNENGLDYRGKSPRDIRFGNAWVTYQVNCFAI